MALSDNEEKDDNNISNDNSNNNSVHPSLSLSSTAVVRNNHKSFKFIQKFITNLFPIFNWIPLGIHNLPSDIIAGIHLGLYQIIQCIAYSLIVQYPLVHLLHTNIISSIMYTIIGHHRRLSYGVFTLISAIYFRIILNRLGHEDSTAESVTILVTFLISIFTMLTGLLRLGSLIRFIPNEMLAGYRSGVYILVITLLLRSMGGKRPWMNLGDARQLMLIPDLYRKQLFPCLFQHINWNSWGVSMGCLAIMGFFRGIHHYWDNLFRGRCSVLRKIIRRIPVEMALITLSMMIVRYSPTITSQYKIYLIDSVHFKQNDTTLLDYYEPNFHFHFQWPSFGKYFVKVWPECINATILLLCYTHSLSIDYNIMDTERIRRDNPRKRKRQLNPKRMKFYRMGWCSYNPNNEMIVSGFINFCSSFFKCLPCGPSRIRSNRMRNVGACTQISGLIASLVTLFIWIIIPKNYLSQIPICVVASIVTFETIMALIFEIQQLKYYWKLSIVDATVWFLTISSFLLLNIELSLYCSIGLSLLVYCFRTKNFKLFKFQPEKALITLNDSVVLVPETSPENNNVVSREENDLGDHGCDDDTTSNIFKMIPQSTLKSIQIYKVDQQLLTVSNMDAFVLDVCRKVSKTIKRFKKNPSNPSNIINRLIFDCRSFRYMDWPSIRLVKATVMRMIQVSESWNPTIQSPFVITSNNDDHNQSEQKLKQYLIVVFVFPTQMIQMIHNTGKFNIHFYHSLHQCLHITLKGAINMVISFPNINNNNTNNDQFDTIVSEQEIIINKIQSDPSSPNIQSIRTEDIPKISNQIPMKPLKQSKQSRLTKKFISLDRKRQKRSLDHEDSSKNDSEQISNENDVAVLPISFRKQNLDHEFDLPSTPQPSTSKSYPTLEIIEEKSLKNYFDTSASTSSIKRKDASSQTKPPKPSRSDSTVYRPPRSPPPPPLQIESNKSMVSFQTANSDLDGNEVEIKTSLDQNDDADTKTNSTRISEIRKRLETLLGGGKISETFKGINGNNNHDDKESSNKMEESEF